MPLFSDGDETVNRTGHDRDYDSSPAGLLGCVCLLWVMEGMMQLQTKINRPYSDILLRKTMDGGGRRDVWFSDTPPVTHAVKGFSLALIGRRASVGGSVGLADWPCVLGAVDNPPGGVWIDFIRRTMEDSQSIVAAPVTGSVVSPTLFSCREANYTYRSSIFCVNSDTDWILPAWYQVLLLEHAEGGTMDADGFSIVDNRAGVTFGVELYVPWDALEMVIDLSSTGTVPLRNVPDVFGMSGRRDSAMESRILQGWDARSIRVLVPDCRGLNQNFHDVTIVDMGDLPESQVSIPELSELAHKWPPAVINHMRWRQPEMKQAARVQYRKKQPAPCEFCGTLIRCDMGAPQNLMDHMRGAHRVPEEVQNIKLETLIPPWTVTLQVYTDSLTSRHSGISNDILLFSDIGMSLAHHYRVHKRGVPHVAFRRNYMSQLHALLHLSAVLSTEVRIRDVRQWGTLRMLWAPRLDRLDTRLLASGQLGSGRHRDELHLVSQYRIH